MESFNKVLSFIIGLVVVIILIVVITNRLSGGKNPIRFLPLQSGSFKVKVTTSPARLTPTPTKTVSSTGRTIRMSRKPGLIPKTGPGLLLPIAASMFGIGIFLRRK